MIGSSFGVDEQMRMGLNMFLKIISALTVTEFILQTFRSQDTPQRVTNKQPAVAASALPGAGTVDSTACEGQPCPHPQPQCFLFNTTLILSHPWPSTHPNLTYL